MITRLSHLMGFLAAAAALASSVRAQSYIRVPIMVQPPQEVRAVTLRAAGQAHSCSVHDGVLLVPSNLPLPWSVGLVRFEPTQYTRTDLERNTPVLLRKQGELRLRLRPRPPPGESVGGYFLRSGDAASTESPLVVNEEGVFGAWLASGIYVAAFVGDTRATRIRSGIVINPGEATDIGELSFESNASVTLRIVDDTTRQPVAGARVTWSPPDALNADVARLLFNRVWSSTTDRRGSVTFRSIGPPPLTARWMVRAANYAPTLTPRVVIADTRRLAVPDTSIRQETILIVDAVLPRDADEFRNASLVFSEPEDDDSPRYKPLVRQRLREGENKLKLTSSGRRRLLIEGKGGKTLLYQDVEIGPTDRRIVIAPLPTEIRGVVRRSGEPVKGVLVTAADSSDARTVLAQATTDTDGGYTLSTFQKGDILVYTNGPVEDGTSTQAVLRHITLTGDPEVRADFVLPTAGANIVVVDAESGSPLRARLEGRLVYGGGRTRGILLETDNAGRTKIAGAPTGEAILFVRSDGYRGRGITVDVRSDASDLTVELTKGGSISGRVVDRHGVAIPGARVLGGYPSPFAMRGYFDTVTDASGTFELGNTAEPRGLYYVIAKGHALGVTVLREEVTNIIRLSPPNSGAVTLVADHAPPKTLSLFLAAPRGSEIIPYRVLHELGAVNGMTPFQLLSSGSDGRLILPEFLSEGDYTLYVVAPPGKSRPEQYQKVADLRIPARPGTVITLPK